MSAVVDNIPFTEHLADELDTNGDGVPDLDEGTDDDDADGIPDESSRELGDLVDLISDASDAAPTLRGFAKAYVNRALSYHKLQRYDEALVDYGQAAELEPNQVEAYVGRGNTVGRHPMGCSFPRDRQGQGGGLAADESAGTPRNLHVEAEALQALERELRLGQKRDELRQRMKEGLTGKKE